MIYRRSNFLRLAFLILALSGTSIGFAQNSTSSPYSRFGIGDVQTAGSTQFLGMGGTSTAFQDGLMLNFNNPAAYAKLQLCAFEAGMNATLLRLQSTDASRDNNSLSLGYFALAFPLKSKKAGLGFGIVPLSNVGYSIYDYQVNALNNVELHAYEGSGGLNQFFVSTGFTPFKNLTLGLNASTLFGNLIQERRVEFNDISFLNTRLTDTRSVRGFYFTAGMQYTVDSLRISPSDSLVNLDRKIIQIEDSLSRLARVFQKVKSTQDTVGYQATVSSLRGQIRQLQQTRSGVQQRRQRGDWGLTFGFTFSPTNSLSARRSQVAETFRYINTGEDAQVVVADTTYINTGESGRVELPQGLGLGVALRKGSQWLIGTDFRTQDWSQYSSFGETRWQTAGVGPPELGGYRMIGISRLTGNRCNTCAGFTIPKPSWRSTVTS